MAKKNSAPRKLEACRCVVCPGTMKPRTKTDTVQYKGHAANVKVYALWCSQCDEAIFDGEAIQVQEKALLALKAEVDGLLRPEQIRAYRKALALTQSQAGLLIGGGVRAFQKYESGQILPSLALSNLLRLLASDPSRLEELKGSAMAKPFASTRPKPANNQKGTRKTG